MFLSTFLKSLETRAQQRERVLRSLVECIPEIASGMIQVKEIAIRVGFGVKIALTSTHGTLASHLPATLRERIRLGCDPLTAERLDIIQWSDTLEEYVVNALHPASVEEVYVYELMCRVVAIVTEEQLARAIGRNGTNVALASELCHVDIDVMQRNDLASLIQQAAKQFSELEGISHTVATTLVTNGIYGFADLSLLEPTDLVGLGFLTLDQATSIIMQADHRIREESKRM